MMSNREEMIAEAIDLGLEFKGNISNKALAALLAEAKGEPEPLNETPPPSPAMKPQTEEEDVLEAAAEIARNNARERAARNRARVGGIKANAMKTKVVTLTSKDSRDNETVTTAFLSMQNKHFAIARNVPLDTPVELEQCLINTAESCMITQHRDEIVNGKRTGNKVPVRVKKYAVSYSPIDPD